MKIILWDLETLPLVVTSWGLFKPRLSHDNIIEDSTIVCAAWKSLDAKSVQTASVKVTSPRNDKELCRILREALAAADVLVAHNGDKFDLRVLNARLIYHGLEPLPPIRTVDTLKVARKHFRFTANRLDYLGEFLKLGRKIPTEYGLWLDILLNRSKKSLAKMIAYNKQDVLLLEKVYKKLRPFAPSGQGQCDGKSCPICSVEGHLQKRGFRVSRTVWRQSFQCQSCGGWSSGVALKRSKAAGGSI